MLKWSDNNLTQFSCFSDLTDIIDLLLYFGCPLTTQNRFGETALHIAAKGNPQFVERLLQGGSSVNSRDNAGISLTLKTTVMRVFMTEVCMINEEGKKKERGTK